MSGPDFLGASWRAAITMLGAFWKLARQVFHEATGTLFALFAVYAGTACWKQLHQPGNQWVAAFAAGYAAAMTFFSISSFRSARRVR